MRLDPRTKLLILAVTSVSVFMNKSIAVECVLAGIPLALLSTSGNLKRMLKYAAFFLTLLLIQLFIVPRLPVTFGGIVYMFAVYIRKLLPCFMLGSFLIATTGVSKFLAAITKLRLSKGLTIALAVTLRYFPTMREEWASIQDAMALRGISASAAGLISHPIQTMEHVYVPLLVSASRISDEITQAAITRGIEHTGERSCINGRVEAGTLITCIILALGLVKPLIQALQYTDSLAMVDSTVKEVGNLLDEPELVRPTERAVLADADVSFDHVTFRYKETEVLHGISFDCAKNGMTAIVGPSGSGKSTIARLIASFWEAESGGVRIGGVDVRNIPLPQIMEIVSYVSQDNFLFHLSIRENIRIGKPEATDAEIEAAAKKASCHDFIAALPEGYDTLAGDAGSHLSGGERQRIAIARAILKNSPIVVLDEATAFTDPENEAVIQASIAGLVAGKTLIVIAHRLSTITKADKILVVDKGNIAAEGTHEELLETSNLYKELWKAHMQGKDTAEEVA